MEFPFNSRSTMADDRSNRGGQDRQRVSVEQEHEVRYWTGKWGVSEEELRSAVEQVGPMVSDLERHFGPNRTSRSSH
jgi:uncharacterized protein DUF3606